MTDNMTPANRKRYDWSGVDWSQGTNIIAAKLGCSAGAVSGQRRKRNCLTYQTNCLTDGEYTHLVWLCNYHLRNSENHVAKAITAKLLKHLTRIQKANL